MDTQMNAIKACLHYIHIDNNPFLHTLNRTFLTLELIIL